MEKPGTKHTSSGLQDGWLDGTLCKLTHAIYMNFSAVKIENFVRKILIFFFIFAQNIDRGYTLEPPHRSIPLYTPVFLYKTGVQGGILFMDMFS